MARPTLTIRAALATLATRASRASRAALALAKLTAAFGLAILAQLATAVATPVAIAIKSGGKLAVAVAVRSVTEGITAGEYQAEREYSGAGRAGNTPRAADPRAPRNGGCRSGGLGVRVYGGELRAGRGRPVGRVGGLAITCHEVLLFARCVLRA